jgi:hypothetical protein
MKTSLSPSPDTRRVVLRALVAAAVVFGICAPAFAQGGKKANPASKMYISDVSGEALIDTGERIEDVSKRSVYNAQGTIIETKKPTSDADREKYFSTMVYSNGTGAFFDADTRVEVRRFAQEPFTPTRTDIEVEPSISQTQAFVSRGTVGLCTSKLVAGSNMTYQTPHGSVNIRGRKLVIETHEDVTKVSMIDGDSTVRAGPNDVGGHTVHAGEQAVIRRGAPGQPNAIEVIKIPRTEMPLLDDKVAMACMAKRTVYFDVRERKADSADGDGVSGAVTAFDGSGNAVTREIVPIEIVPANLPVQFTVSPATILTPGQTGPGGP